MSITVSCYISQFYVGIKEEKNGSTYLNEVYAYIVYNGKHGFISLPGEPKTICIDNASFHYDITEGEVFELYNKHLKTRELNQNAIIVLDENKIVLAS